MDQLPFIPGQIYNRPKDIHAKYSGNWQSGICPSANYPYIFIFSGKTGHQHGYKDGWDNPKGFSYTGEGQAGDMKFTKGNLALRDHVESNKSSYFFLFSSAHIDDLQNNKTNHRADCADWNVTVCLPLCKRAGPILWKSKNSAKKPYKICILCLQSINAGIYFKRNYADLCFG